MPEVYQKVSATLEIATKSYISCQHPAIVCAFQVLGPNLWEVMSVVIGVFCSSDNSKAQSRNCVCAFRDYLKTSTVFQKPCAQEGTKGYFLKVTCDASRIFSPGDSLEERNSERFRTSSFSRSNQPYVPFFQCFLVISYQRGELSCIPRSKDIPLCKLLPTCRNI